MPDASIRRATPEDVPTLITLYREFHTFHVNGLPLWLREPKHRDDEQLRAALLDILANDAAAIFVVAADGAVVGLAEAYLRQDEADPSVIPYHYGYLQSLFVSDSWREKGLGSALLTAAQDWATLHGATQLRLSTWEFTVGPLDFYEKQGYRTVKRTLVATLEGEAMQG
jgi:GNAT superfamily N-acetyltransferase